MRYDLILERSVATVCRSEVVTAFTYALDLTEGQPQGHSIRACYIASELAREIGVVGEEWAAVYYATLLKDLGCSSNAARIHEIYSRCALLAQVADVFHAAGGAVAACTEVALCSGSWFDPVLAEAFVRIANRAHFWSRLTSPTLEMQAVAMAPDLDHDVDEDYLDAITAAFGQVIDAKSPFTAGHSARVADYTVKVGERLGVLPSRLRRLKRAATLHDIGKLGISSAILEKPWQAGR